MGSQTNKTCYGEYHSEAFSCQGCLEATSCMRSGIAKSAAVEAVLRSVKSLEQDPNGINAHSPGAKLDAGKPMAGVLGDFGLALLEVAKVGTFGAKKYSRGGWQSVENGRERYRDAAVRHLLIQHVEELDDQSDLLHLAHQAWNVLAELELKLRDASEPEKIRRIDIIGQNGGEGEHYDSEDKGRTITALTPQSPAHQ